MPGPLAAALPYALPYLGFLLVLEAGRLLPEGAQAWVLPVQVAVPGLLLLGFLARGAFPELRGPRASAGARLADVLLGLAIAALWTTPYLLVDTLPRPAPEAAFDPAVLGEARRGVAWALRATGFALVTPFVEELFVRGLLWRWIASGAGSEFRHVPPAVRDGRAAVGTTLVFTVTHVPWEWIVALPTGALLAAWLWRRGDLRACIRAHLVANAALLLGAWALPGRFAIFL